jgi:prevent-host-death family protein
MAEVSIQHLRNHWGEVIDRVQAGERVTITRDGRPVAELHPVESSALSAAEVLRRWRQLPPMDPDRLRAEIDAIIDPSL